MAAASASKKVIAVFGATGSQGGNVIRGLLATRAGWSIRALTRNPESPKALALKELGCEVVEAEASDRDSLSAALKGAYGAFANTQFWEKLDGNLELEQGKNIAEACADAGVQHVVFSSLEDTRELNKVRKN